MSVERRSNPPLSPNDIKIKEHQSKLSIAASTAGVTLFTELAGGQPPITTFFIAAEMLRQGYLASKHKGENS